MFERQLSPAEPLLTLPVAQHATAAIETAINVLLKDRPDYARRLARLKGQVLTVHFKEVDRTLVFIFNHRVDVLAHYEGESDCHLSLRLSALSQLKAQQNISELIKQDKIVLTGDIQLAQQFAQLMIDCKPDLEEWLSRITGDIVAHTLVQGTREVGCWLKKSAHRQQLHLAQVLTQEWQIAPPPLEVAYFCDQVSAIDDQVTALDKRLNELLEKL